MTITTDHGERDEIVRLVLEGAAANSRPDLARRLRAAGTTEVPAIIERALESLEVDLRSRRAALVEPGRGARLDAESRHAEQRRRTFEEHAARWPRLLGDALSAVDSDFEYAVSMRLRSLIEEGTALIEAGRLPDSWLREHLATVTEESERSLRSSLAAAAGQLATTLDLTVPPPTTTVTLDLPPATDPRPARADRPPIAGRLLGVVMPTYGGMMIPVVLPRVFDVDLPLWMVVAAAGLGAIPMGGAALAGERQRQAGRRNAEAIGDLRSAVDTFRMTLSKQARDAVRTVEQELHAAVGDAVRQRTRRLTAEAAMMRDQAARCKDPGPALKDIDDDLDSVRELRLRARKLMQ